MKLSKEVFKTLQTVALSVWRHGEPFRKKGGSQFFWCTIQDHLYSELAASCQKDHYTAKLKAEVLDSCSTCYAQTSQTITCTSSQPTLTLLFLFAHGTPRPVQLLMFRFAL